MSGRDSRGGEGGWLHSAWGLSAGGGWLWSLALFGAMLMVTLSVHAPIAPITLLGLSVGAYLLYQAPWLSLVAFALGRGAIEGAPGAPLPDAPVAHAPPEAH